MGIIKFDDIKCKLEIYISWLRILFENVRWLIILERFKNKFGKNIIMDIVRIVNFGN